MISIKAGELVKTASPHQNPCSGRKELYEKRGSEDNLRGRLAERSNPREHHSLSYWESKDVPTLKKEPKKETKLAW